MPSIQQLSAHVVNKIAAGEVIERPASVVKELLENSVDAGASRIDVTVEQGGGRLIRVVDNGCGIGPEELPLAVASHATSKIRSDEDLFSVQTLGFRGEALASIASVSRMKFRSRVAGAESGAELQFAADGTHSVAPCGCPQGTTVEIHDLFFNTPVRRKFLRTTQTEMGHVTEAFTRMALAYPSIHFTLAHNERGLYDLPPADSWRGRIATFFGSELAESLIGVESSDGEIRLSGFAADPSQSRGNNRTQYLFLNGRYIRDRSLQHALSEAYRGLLMTGRFPICFIRLEMPPQMVDVNVHPTKLEVRFQDGGRVYSHLLGTLRTRFLNTDLTARLRPAAAATSPVEPDAPAEPQADRRSATDGFFAAAKPSAAAASSRPNLTSAIPPFKPFDSGSGFNVTHRPPAAASPTPSPVAPPDAGPSPSHRFDEPAVPATRPPGPAEDQHRVAPSEPQAAAPTPAMQVLNRYLIAEMDNGVIVIDQHALHERILYEEIREKVLGGAMETQNLLVPEPVDLSPAEAAAVLDAQEMLAQLGVKVEPFGGGTVLISSYPAMLANWNPAELLRTLADQLTSGGKPPDRRDLLDELLHMISCKAAIKAGDRLSPAEIDELLERRDLAQDAHHCPHGRPTALVFTRDELDKQFKRT